jgi:CheY-like chemotaxis protein
MQNNAPPSLNILLADDDRDDCFLFQEALGELQVKAKLTSVYDGEQLMHLLNKKTDEPFNVLFLDLNMPRKNGFACLEEIKGNENIKSLPIIIFSTSNDKLIVDGLYKNGALHFICKPDNFSQLKKTIESALLLIPKGDALQHPKEKFLVVDLESN